MSLLIAPPEIFSAHAITTVDPARFGHWGVERETYLPDEATFLRLYAGGAKSFPVAPFAVFQTFSNEEPLTGYSLEVHGGELDPDNQIVTVFDGQDAWVGLNLPQYRFDAAVRVDLVVEGQLRWAQIYDPSGRLIDARNQPGWSFSAPAMRWLWLQGDARVGIRIRTTNLDSFFGSRTPEGEEYTIGLPARFADEPFAGAEPQFTDPSEPGRLRWYLGLHDAAQGDARVRTAAPFTTNRMDSPTGPFLGTDQDGESNRVAARLRADERFWPRLFKLLHGDLPPWARDNYDDAITDVVGPTTQSAHLPRLGMLQITAMDPGMAQFLGFSTMLPGQVPDLPRMEGADPALATGWDTLGAIGLFALDPDEVKRRLRVVPDPQQDDSRFLLDMLATALGPRSGGPENARALLDEQIQRVRDLGAIPAVYATFAAPVLPPRPPQLPVPQVVSHHWQQSTDGNPSRFYRAGFAFPRPPAVTLASIGRDNGDGPLTVHEPDGTGRVIPGIMGYEFEPNVRLRQLRERKRVQTNAGLISDKDIDADWGEVRYFFSASDPFGRFGQPVECVVGPPERPKPRAPVMRSWIEPPGEADPPELPGRLRVRVAIPSPNGVPFPADRIKELGSAIVVPRIDELAAGSLKLVRLDLNFGNVTHQVDLDEPGFIDKSFDLPVLAVGGSDKRVLTGTFFDSSGDSKSEKQTICFFDRRPPPTLATGFGLYWTSAPGPSPEVEVSIDWNGDPGSLYRVYLADAGGLGLPAGIDETKSRGDVADAGCKRAIDSPGEIDPANFRLLEKDAVVAGGDGVARYRGKLPRSISTVQFLKVVPVSKDGLEAKFADAPIVPIAVPESRRPPLPLLDGDVDEATGRVRLVVTSDGGFNRNRLIAEERGLFAAAPSGQPPEFRIRRAFGDVVDPIYARVVHSGPMKVVDRDAAIPAFAGTWSEGADILEPFVRYTYWGEARLPAERRGPAGLPLGGPGGLTAPDEVSRKDHPRPFSPVSAPRQLMWYPKAEPAPPQAVATRLVDAAGSVFVQVTLTDPPRAHRYAVDEFRIAAWWQWNSEPLQTVDNVGGVPLPEGGWPGVGEGTVTFRIPPAIDAGSAPLTVRIAYVDPLGRVGSIAKLDVVV